MANSFESYLRAEDKLHKAVVEYLDYNNILFVHAPLEGKRSFYERWLMTLLGGKRKKGFPDLFCFEPREVNGKLYYGLAIELKEGKNPASEEQEQWLIDLNSRGYFVALCYGLDESLEVINKYFGFQKK